MAAFFKTLKSQHFYGIGSLIRTQLGEGLFKYIGL